MASISDYNLPPPQPWERFEDLIWDLFKAYWNDPNAQKVGRPGQAQNGVDVYGNPDGGLELVGVQCKRTAGPPTDTELRSLVAEAKTFTPPLDSFIIAAAADNDAKTQQLALTVSRENQRHGSFSVTVLGWNELQRRLKNFPLLVDKYYGNLFPPFVPPPLEAPRPVFTLRDDGQQPGRHAPDRVVSLVGENRGGGTLSDFTLMLQVPFVPASLSQPIAPDRIIRPLLGTERDGAEWRCWKHWVYTGGARPVLGITIVSAGQIKLYRPAPHILCQFRLPVSWFSRAPRPTTYRCVYSLSYPDAPGEEGTLPLTLFELVDGHY